MRSKIWIFMFYFATINYNTCYGVFGLEKIKPIMGDMALMKVGVAENADAIAKVDANLSARIDKVEANVNAQGAVIAGVNNRVTQTTTETTTTSGRDMTQTQTTTTSNDTKMLMDLNNIFKAIILALLVQMIALVKFTAAMYHKIIDRMQVEMTRILESKDRKESKIDDFQNKMIETLTKRG